MALSPFPSDWPAISSGTVITTTATARAIAAVANTTPSAMRGRTGVCGGWRYTRTLPAPVHWGGGASGSGCVASAGRSAASSRTSAGRSQVSARAMRSLGRCSSSLTRATIRGVIAAAIQVPAIQS